MLLDIHPDNPDDRKIKEVISILENDGLIVIPTDTIYAFAASIKSKKGLERFYKVHKLLLFNNYELINTRNKFPDCLYLRSQNK